MTGGILPTAFEVGHGDSPISRSTESPQVTVWRFLNTEALDAYLTGEKSHRRDGRFTREFRQDLALAAMNRCVYCGDELNPHSVEIDHIVPRSHGGEHSIDNLAPACFKCNSLKAASPLEEFRWIYAVRRSPVGRLVNHKTASELIRQGATLPIDPNVLFFFEEWFVVNGEAKAGSPA